MRFSHARIKHRALLAHLGALMDAPIIADIRVAPSAEASCVLGWWEWRGVALVSG